MERMERRPGTGLEAYGNGKKRLLLEGGRKLSPDNYQ